MFDNPPSPAGEACYSDHDLKPLRAALLALSKGDFTRHSRTGTEAAAAHGGGGVLGHIWPLVDAVAAGASEYVTKPVDISHLIGLMRSWLEWRPRTGGQTPRRF